MRKGEMMKTEIKNDERGLLFLDGNYSRCLKPGKHKLPMFALAEVKLLKVDEPFSVQDKNINLFLEDEELKQELDIIDVQDDEIVLHYEDKKLVQVLRSGKYAFWNVLKKHGFKVIRLDNPLVDESISKNIFLNPALSGFFQVHEVFSHETGLLFLNNVFQNTLKPGKYYFWNTPVSVSVLKADTRQLQLDIAGQEILTEDKISLRLNFICHYKITNPIKALLEIKGYDQQIYILLQLVLREYVGMMKFDDLLKKKEEIGSFVLDKLKEKEKEFGVEFIFAGVKDIVLPGEMKEILNTVLIAEKKAQANLIERREGTASTRSLLNTARLMEDNPTLLKLKELEYVEKICSKIGNISMVGGGTVLEQILSLVKNQK